MKEKVLLKAAGIYKSFSATKALKDVSLELQEGEVLALIGENGSGKSTLVSIISGAQKKDEGTIEFHNKTFLQNTVLESRSLGIAILAQELGTVNGMSVAENIFLGIENEFGNSFHIQKKKMNHEAKTILKEIGAEKIDPREAVENLNFEDRKLVEVARAMYHKPEILIVDETTTALSQNGRETIYRIIKKMKKEKKAVIFISHDLEEVQAVCDTAEVLRDGVYITKLIGSEVTPDNMRKNMIGRDLADHYYREDTKGTWEDTIVFKAENISWDFLKDINFELHKGEILGLGGLSDCGMHELCKILYGAIKPTTGEITIVQSNSKVKSPSDAIKSKMAYLPKDRDQESLFLTTSIMDNIVVSSLDQIKKGFFIPPQAEKGLSTEISEKLSIKMLDIKQQVKELSGGNKQKVALAKWLANESEILIMDCPTRGIDIGVKSTIYSLMEELKKSGKSIIMISEEMPELIGMSDRILIIKDGKIKAEFSRDEVNEQMLIKEII